MISIEPVHVGDFDYCSDRNEYQVRIHVWGWLGKLFWRLMQKSRGLDPGGNSVCRNHEKTGPHRYCRCRVCTRKWSEGYQLTQEKAGF